MGDERLGTRCTAQLNGNPPPSCDLRSGHDGDHQSYQPHGILSWPNDAKPPLPASESVARVNNKVLRDGEGITDLEHIAHSFVHGGFEPDGQGGCSCTICSFLRDKVTIIRHNEAESEAGAEFRGVAKELLVKKFHSGERDLQTTVADAIKLAVEGTRAQDVRHHGYCGRLATNAEIAAEMARRLKGAK